MGISVLQCRLIFLWTVWPLLALNAQQLMWTTIYVDASNQIDLWTQKAEGCQCPWDKNSYECACCVEDGGCPCGKRFPNRCAQCGLEFYCDHMCNVSIISTELKKKSGKSFGQIKSPSLQGPDACSYTFIPDKTERVEIQIYRVVNVGRHNGTICVGGFLQLAAGTEPIYSYSDYQICGGNERYSPPVVFFSDDDVATLLLHSKEPSRFRFFILKCQDLNSKRGEANWYKLTERDNNAILILWRSIKQPNLNTCVIEQTNFGSFDFISTSLNANQIMVPFHFASHTYTAY